MTDTDLSWLKQLPTFPYLPQEMAEVQLEFSPVSTTRSLQDFHAYVSRIREAVDDKRNHVLLGDRISEIVDAYCAAFYIATHSAVSPIQLNSTALRRVSEDSLRAIFILRDHLAPAQDHRIYEYIDAQILAATFSPRSTYHFLTPLFTIPRNMVDKLSLATRSFTKPKLDQTDEVSEEAAILVCDLLRMASTEVKGLGGLGPEGRMKKEKHDAGRRALRIGIELDVWRAELAFAMTNANMAAVKARAGILHEPGMVATEAEPVGEDGEEDVQPNLDPEDDEISLPDSPSPVKAEPDHDATQSQIRWEEMTEEMLVALLREARTLVVDGHASVLSDGIERGDWLGHQPEEIPLPGTPTKRGKSLSAEEENEDEDEDFDETSSESSEESMEVSDPCPLRSIFSLYDRFEEQRLAVWTSLPQSINAHKGRRKEMEQYMRGTDGAAGEAGEELGLVLLIEYDRQALISYGLSYDKLDKWLELASNRNAKKFKRRKAAAPALRGRGGSRPRDAAHRKTASINSNLNLDIPAARTRGKSKTPALSVVGIARGGTPKRGRKAK